jgi:hypothetical protein
LLRQALFSDRGCYFLQPKTYDTIYASLFCESYKISETNLLEVFDLHSRREAIEAGFIPQRSKLEDLFFWKGMSEEEQISFMKFCLDQVVTRSRLDRLYDEWKPQRTRRVKTVDLKKPTDETPAAAW